MTMTLAAGILAGAGLACAILGVFFLFYARDLVADSEQANRVAASWYTNLLTETLTAATTQVATALKVLATPPPPPVVQHPTAPSSTPAYFDLDGMLDDEAAMDARLARRERRAPTPIPDVEAALDPRLSIEE